MRLWVQKKKQNGIKNPNTWTEHLITKCQWLNSKCQQRYTFLSEVSDAGTVNDVVLTDLQQEGLCHSENWHSPF